MLSRPEAVATSVPGQWRELLRNWLLRGIYRFGWQVAARLPPRSVALIISVASWVALRHDGVHVRTLRRNLALTTGAPVHSQLVRAALKSYLRNFYEVLALPAWSETEIRRRVSAVNEPVVRGAHAGPGVVVALPHSGNWDLAGAWACATGMPVTTVAEQLSDAEYADFVAFRKASACRWSLIGIRAPSPHSSTRSIADGSSACWRIGTCREPEYRCPGGAIPSPCRPARR